MPFTLAHPAIFIPIGNTKRLSLTALIVGSMVPDFEFFFQLREVENVGHHWYGIILFDIPVGIVLCYIFHNFLKNLFILNMPANYRRRFINFISFNWNIYFAGNKLRVFGSLLLAILSHITWDAFTHSDGFFVLAMPVLSAQFRIAGAEMPIYFLLQIFCSVAGMWVLYRAIEKIPTVKQQNLTVRKISYYWPSFIIVFSIILSVRIYIWPQYNSFWGVVMALMGGFIYTWILISFIFKYIQLKNLQS